MFNNGVIRMGMIEIPDDLITQSEAARIRMCSRQAIYNLLDAFRIKYWDIGGIRFVRRIDIERFKTLPVGRRPNKSKVALSG